MVSLELPPQIFETVGMWLEIPDAGQKRHLRQRRPFHGRHPRPGARPHRHVSALRPGGPLRHRRHLPPGAPPGGPGRHLHLRRLPRRGGPVGPGLRDPGRPAQALPGGHRGLPLRGRLPLLHPLPQVRLGQQTPGQGGGREHRRHAPGAGRARRGARVPYAEAAAVPAAHRRRARHRRHLAHAAEDRNYGPGDPLLRRRRGRLGPVPPYGGLLAVLHETHTGDRHHLPGSTTWNASASA